MKRYSIILVALTATACSTMNESLQLGGTIGATTGAAATLTGYEAAGKSPSFGTVALGAGLGSIAGFLTSYLVHNKVEEERNSIKADQTEMHFGDLPPSPFVFPRKSQKGGR